MPAISLDKIQREAPELVDLVKKSRISLDKHQMSEHTARVALVLDISGSMDSLYRSGQIDELVKRTLPLGLQFDDDGQIDVFAFGINAHSMGEFGLSNYKTCVKTITTKHRLESGTKYHKALAAIEEHYEGTTLPVYVMFVTDGETSDEEMVTKYIRSLSAKPVFLQFIALGEDYFPDGKDDTAQPAAKKKGFFGSLFGSTDSAPAQRQSGRSGFRFLRSIDEMSGRKVDNANFFAMRTPTSVSDERLYELLMNEYPQWLKEARKKGILR